MKFGSDKEFEKEIQGIIKKLKDSKSCKVSLKRLEGKDKES